MRVDLTTTTGRLSSNSETGCHLKAEGANGVCIEHVVEPLRGELNAILAFVEQLAEVDVEGVEPMTSVTPMAMKMRVDGVTDGGKADAIMANAPAREDQFFVVPKVVE